MCGIAGMISSNGTIEAGIIQKMTDSMEHRGPNASGYFTEDGIALGHRRLSIIDLSTSANQPFHDNSRRYVMVFNGEIYNFKEIKPLLPEYEFLTNSDTEVVIASFDKWGIDCVSYFKGMFAMAIWDKKTSRLTLIRDRMGVKPLYYYSYEGNLYFASEIRAILASNLVPKTIDQKGLYEYFSYQSIGTPHTIIKGIKQLPAGQYLEYHKGEISIKTYWSLLQQENHFDWNDKKAVQNRIRHLLSDAVERRLVSDVPVGAFLSGGIDSSIVVGLMASVNEKATNTFNIYFDEAEYDESSYADLVAKKFKTNHTKIKLVPKDFMDELETALKCMDTPSGDGINTYVVSKAIRRAGITVALSGIGGDELFAGYPIFKQFDQLHSFNKIWKPTSLFRHIAAAFSGSGTNRQQRIQEILTIPSPEIEFVYPVSRKMLTKRQIINLTTLPESPTAIEQALLSNSRSLHSFPILSQVTIAELMGYTQQTLLKDTDQMSMAVTLEVREPFFDHELVSFVLAIPDDLKKPVYPKSLLVESVKPLLPGEIVHRKKKGFTFPWNEWMKNELKEFCTVRIQRMANRDFIKGPALERSWNSFLNGSTSMRWAELWLFIVLEEWLTNNGVE